MPHALRSPRRPRSQPAERAQWAFARQHRLRLATLQRWLRQTPSPPAAPVFTEVQFAAAPPRWAAEVVSPDGTVVRQAVAPPPQLLQQLLSPC